MSCAELFEPSTTQCLPRYGSPRAVAARVVQVALERVRARDAGDVRQPGHARGQHEVPRPEHDRRAVAHDADAPFAGGLVVAGARALGAAPEVELHDLRVHLQPVAHLILGRVDGPVIGERDVRHVVEPHRVVERERLVAVAPRVAGPRAALDDDRRHAQAPQPGAEADPALSAPDDHDVWLRRVAEPRLLVAAALLPGDAVLHGAELHPERARTGPAPPRSPFNSCRVVSSVQQRPSRRRT